MFNFYLKGSYSFMINMGKSSQSSSSEENYVNKLP